MNGSSQDSSSTSNPKEDIILICEPSKITNLFTKERVIIWYDPNIDSSDYLPYIEQLKAISDLKTFQNWEEACSCISQLESACQIITSASNGEPFCQAISHIQNVSNIHVFSTQEDPKHEWIKDYPQIACVEKDFDTLLKKIKENMIKQKHNPFLRSSFPAFCPVFDDLDKSIVNHFHLYLKGFVNFQNRNQAKKDFLRLARDAYQDEEHIQEFENTYNDYNQKAILNWYTKESFFYRVTNNCLRIASSDSVQYCRFILKDLETAIKECFEQKSKLFHGLLYRGAYLYHQEWVEIEENIGKEIQIFGFLSTSKGKDAALKFAQSDVARKVLITIIVPDMPTKDEQGFAELSEFTDVIGEEEEVLFNVRSKFTIIEASVQEIDGQQCRHLVLLYGVQEMRKHVSIEEPIVEICVPKKDEISCSECHSKTDMSSKQELFFVGLHDKDYYSCSKCASNPEVIKKSPFLCVSSANPDFIADTMNVKLEGFLMKYNQDLAIPFYGSKCLGCEQKEPIYQQFRCLTCQQSPRTWCKKCGDKIHDCMEKKHNVIYECQPFTFWSEKMTAKEAEYFYHQELTSSRLKIFEQGQIYYLAQDFGKAKHFYEEFLKQGGCDNPYQISRALASLGHICYYLGLHQEAIVWHMKDLKLTDAIFGEDTPLLAPILNGIGNNFDLLGEYPQACQFHLKALTLRLNTYGEKHSDTAQSFCNLGIVYNNLKQYPQAEKCLSKSIEIDTELHGPTYLSLSKPYNFLGIVLDNLGHIEGSIECYLRSIEINKTVHGEIHPDIAMTYNNLAIIMIRLGNFDKSIEFQQRSLSIKMTLFGENHPRIADSFTNLASVYLNTKEYDKAIEFFQKSLEIYQKFFGEKHVRTIKSYQNLGIAYTQAGDEEKAKEYMAKAGAKEE